MLNNDDIVTVRHEMSEPNTSDKSVWTYPSSVPGPSTPVRITGPISLFSTET